MKNPFCTSLFQQKRKLVELSSAPNIIISGNYYYLHYSAFRFIKRGKKLASRDNNCNIPFTLVTASVRGVDGRKKWFRH